MTAHLLAALAVAIGGAVGAPARYLTDLAVQARHDSLVPWGTLTVNVTGSLVLGLVAGAVGRVGAPAWVLTFVGTGMCGALTTFSTFGYETVRLVQERAWSVAAGYVGLSLAAGVTACVVGWVAGWEVPALVAG